MFIPQHWDRLDETLSISDLGIWKETIVEIGMRKEMGYLQSDLDRRFAEREKENGWSGNVGVDEGREGDMV